MASMVSAAKALLPASRRAAKALQERQRIEAELESAYKSKMAVWGVVFMALVLGIVLGMALLM
ncbi:unnamed protein product, partial [Ectocarpus fasciculatus]